MIDIMQVQIDAHDEILIYDQLLHVDDVEHVIVHIAVELIVDLDAHDDDE